MNLDYYAARMNRLLEDYLDAAWQQERNRKPSELFGLKFGPSDDPLHDSFAKDMAELLGGFASEKPDSTSLRTVLAKLFGAAKEYPDPKSAHWMLVAIQGLAKELIPCLSREDAAALAENYESAWPRRARLPVQDDVLRALKKAAKESPEKSAAE